MIIMIEIKLQGRIQEIQRVSWNLPFRQWQTLDKFYNKTLTFTTFYCKIIENYVVLQ